VLAASACALALAPSAAAASTANLRMTVWPTGKAHEAGSWTVRCTPARGTLPQRTNACRKLSALRTPFAEVPRGVACTAIYGGPQLAHVRGTFRGRHVDTWFNRRDGCEIERWQRVRFLFPVGTR